LSHLHLLLPVPESSMPPLISQIRQACARRIPSQRTHSHLSEPLPLAPIVVIDPIPFSHKEIKENRFPRTKE